MRPDHGFTLLEVLVAFIIAALAVGALLRGSVGGLQATRVAAHEQEALSRARSRLAVLDAALQPGDQSGDDGGGFAWRVRVEPLDMAPPVRPGAARAVLYGVSVGVTWSLDGAARSITLDTQRLGQAPAPPP